MRRRDFISTLAAGSAAVGASTTMGTAAATTADEGTISETVFDSAASLLNAEGKPLTDDSLVAVWASETATNTDSDGNGDAVSYPSDVAIPMVASDGNVLGFGGTFVEDGMDYRYGNEEFALNAWDEHVGSGTVLWDEGHGQYFTKDRFATFVNYAEDNGYTVKSTTSLTDDLSSANGLVITSPSKSFTDAEKDAIAAFVADGGAVFLHTQSDFRDYDQTDNVNDLAASLDLGFRFNDDQVVDSTNNSGVEFVPVTSNFNDSFPYFEDRDGLELDADESYTVTVEEVYDGDTFKVGFDDGREDDVRVLGIDTPEKTSARDAENVDEWEGIDDVDYLQSWSKKATEYAKEQLKGATVTVSFDPDEGVRGTFGRLLGLVEYSKDGSKTLYNREMVQRGYARAYGSSFSRHDEFRRIENRAQAEGRGLWAESDVDALEPIRNTPVEELYFPEPTSVKSSFGGVRDSRVPVYAASSAEQTIEDDGGWFGGFFGDSYEYEDEIPLVAVDTFANVAMFGAPLIIDDYEKSDGYEVDTSEYDNYTFVTNVIDALSKRDGDVLVDGGHGQVGADGAAAAEDAVVFQRYLEGVDATFDQVNDLASADLSEYRAVVVTSPTEPFTFEEASALTEFAFDGGAVILMGAANTTEAARENVNDLARDIGSDLRINEDSVTDATSNVNETAKIPATSNFDRSFDLFDPVPVDDGGKGGDDGGSEKTFTGTVSRGGRATHTYVPQTDDPRQVKIDLSGAEGTDFDLFVTLDGRQPTSEDYDRKSWSYGSDESVTIGAGKLDADAELAIAVEAYSGSGSYTVTVTEK